MRSWVLAILGLAATLSPMRARATVTDCRSAIIQSAPRLARAALLARQRCREDDLGRPGAGPVTCDVAGDARFARMAAKVERRMAKACGGKDHRCGTADDPSLASIGWGSGTCPGIVGDDPTRCRQPLDDCGDVASCLACSAAQASSGLDLYYDGLATSGEPAVARCQRTVGHAAAKLLRTSSEKVRAKALARVCKACGGRDHKCDGMDDLVPSGIAFGGECPTATGPNGRTCGGPLATAADVATCAECLAAARLDCVGKSTAPSDDPQPEECTACCGPRRMVLQSLEGGSFSFGVLPAFTLPAGIQLTIDVGPPDDTCRHDVVVPPDGFTFPPFCLGAFPYTGDVQPLGCALGGALGRGTLWDGRALAPETDLSIAADTSDGLCNPSGQTCALQELEAAFNFLGREAVTSSVSATRGLHLRLDIPTETMAWEDPDGQCPDLDGVFDAADQSVTDDFQLAHFTTATSTVRFTDMNGDECAYAGLGPATEVTRTGSPAAGPCCTPGQRLTLVSTSPDFTAGDPFGDLLTSLTLPVEVVACEDWPGPGASTCDVLRGGGRVVTKLAAADDELAAAAVGTDGRITAAGHTNDGKTGDAVALVRYLEDGSLDQSFGPTGDGRVRTKIGRDDRALALAVQSDGKLLVAGYTTATEGAPRDVLLARYLQDGSPDPSFDQDGILVSPLGPGDDRAEALAIDASGRIVVAGRTSNGTDYDVFVARFTSGGVPDGAFGTGGVTTFDRGGSDDITTGLALQSDGGVLVAVRVGEYPALRQGVMLRLLDDGSPDPAFGTGGVASVAVPVPDSWIDDVALQNDGRIIVAGGATLPTTSRFLVGRLLMDGTPDPSFGTGGLASLEAAPSSEARSVRVLPDGAMIVAGWGETATAPAYNHDFVVTRYTGTGQLDATFGDAGMRIVDFGGAGDEVNGTALMPDGRIVLGGVYRRFLYSYEFSWALARLLPDGGLDPSFNGECAWR